jgi:hypothetical protein
MSPNDNNNNNNVIDLEVLRKQYSNLLISYQSAISEYTNFLNQSDNPLVSIKGQAYNGTGSAGESNASTLEECVASCSKIKSCTGATFISNKCIVRTGDSPLISSTNDSYAIIPKKTQLLLNIESINDQLLKINSQFLDKIKSSGSDYNKTNKQMKYANRKLMSKYENLTNERTMIQKILQEHNNLDNVENQYSMKVTQNYYIYILLTIFTIIIVLILCYLPLLKKTSVEPYSQVGMFKYIYILIFVLIVAILLHFFLFRIILPSRFFGKSSSPEPGTSNTYIYIYIYIYIIII